MSSAPVSAPESSPPNSPPRPEPSAPGSETAPQQPRRKLPRVRLPMLLQSRLFWRNGHRYLRFCARRMGPTFGLRVLPWGRVMVVTEPDVIKQVFTGDAATFHAGEGNSLLGPVLGERSVLVLDEEPHLETRKRMLPPFHGEAVTRYERTIERIVEDEISTWPVGRPFALHPRMRAITLEVILRAVIGVEEPERLEMLREILPRTVELPFHITLMWVVPQLGYIGPWRRYNRTKARAMDMLLDEVRRRRQVPDLDRREDVLSLLIRDSDLDDEDLRDQLMTLLLAGHETTTTGLAWAFERLVRHPAALERARQGDKEYLDAVVSETLRVRPVIPAVARRVTRPVQVAGYNVPAGVTVLPAIAVVHDSDEVYPDAQAFRPERFLEGQGSTYTWIPFGGGRRRCLGAAFASFEMRVCLRTILAATELRPDRPAGERVRPHHITLTPARGARVICERRLPAPAQRVASPASVSAP